LFFQFHVHEALVSFGLFLLEPVSGLGSLGWCVQETQPELDTFPRLCSLSMLPSLKYSIRLIT